MTDRALSPAELLAGDLQRFDAPDDVVAGRLAMAGAVAQELATSEPVIAGVVVGSTALRRCSPRADLDLAVVTAEAPDERFATQWIDGVRVEVERLGWDEAHALTEGSGWVWELRAAARLGTGVPVFDPEGIGAGLATRAAGMVPDAGRYEATLRAVYEVLIAFGQDPDGEPARRLDALRGALDNLALLALLERPRRYQKPKWVLADLLHGGELGLVDALLALYNGGADTVVVDARLLIERAFAAAGQPDHQTLLAMGHAPHHAEASYVSRTLDDAEDLAASGRHTEAQYTALFAARLAAGILATDEAQTGVVDTFAAHGLDADYLALFGPPAAHDLLDTALEEADRRRLAFESLGVPA